MNRMARSRNEKTTCSPRLTILIVGALIAGLIAPAAASAEGYGPDPGPIPPKVTGKWAHTRLVTKIFRQASGKSRPVGQLRLLTEDGFPEVYRVLKQRDVRGVPWVMIGIPARPNGQTGWVRESALGEIRTSYKLLEISRSSYRARLWQSTENGRRKLLWQARIGVGAPGTETPGGNFWVRERIKGFQGGTIYGYMAFGTSAYSKLSDWPGGGVVGVHGTNEPWLLPGAVSHGCIRVKDEDIRQLSTKLTIGTPVRIR